MAGRSLLHRVVRAADHAVFDAPREGRAAEITAWANALGAFGVALGTTALLHARETPRTQAAWLGVATFVVALVLLRLALAHRIAVWLAAAVGTTTAASLGAAAGWLFGHVVETPAAPSIAAVLGALGAAALPAWAYAQVVRRRANNDRDSLIDPVSVPGSGSWH